VKITFPVFGLGGAGGEKALVRIANGLVDRGHDVSFVLPSGGYSKIYPTKAKLIETPPIITGYKRLHVPYVELLTSCIALIPRIPKSDIVCANFCLTALPTLIATKLLKKGTPFYFVQHYESLFFDKSYQLGYRRYIKDTYKYFENIVTVSKWLGDKIYEHTGKRSTVINPGIDLDIFRPLKSEKDDIKTVLCLGVNTIWKGNADIIKAMEIVYEKCRRVKLIIVGRTEIEVKSEIPYEQRQASDEELAELYSSCNVYVLGSWYEGYPAPPLEAMACGAPVVSTDNLGIREYGIDGKNCLIVPPRNPEAMANAILRLLSDKDLCQKLSEEGLKTARQFTWDKTVDKIEKRFEQTLRKGD
jgi:glycosyltransferase involved in cell wall biosynthesis